MSKNLTAEQKSKEIQKILRKHEKRRAQINQNILESLEAIKQSDLEAHLDRVEQKVGEFKKVAAKLDAI